MQTTHREQERSDPALEHAQAAIAVEGLTMRYGDSEVVRSIDFSVGHGEVFAFLGPNGAGKTTTVEILEGFRARSGGQVRVLGADPFGAPAGWRDRIGVVLQSSVPEPDLTVRETIDLYAGFYARPRPTDEVLDLTGLTAQAAARNSRLSGGQQRRLDVALALVGDPDVLFLDEPTTGFDPAARRAAWETLAGLKALGKTVFLTTHYLDEAEYLADRIAVITDGRIAAVGTPSELGGRHCKPSTVRLRLGPIADPVQLPQWLAEGWWRIDHGCIAFSSGDPATDVHRLVEWAMSEGRHVDMLEVLPPSLEDTYLELTQGGQH